MWRTRVSTTMFTTMWLSYDLCLCSNIACVIASNCNHASQYPLAWSLVTHSFRWNRGWDFPLVLMLFLWQIHGMSINVIFTFIFLFWYIEVWKVLFYTYYIYIVHLVFIQCSSMLLIASFVSFGYLVFCPLCI